MGEFLTLALSESPKELLKYTPNSALDLLTHGPLVGPEQFPNFKNKRQCDLELIT